MYGVSLSLWLLSQDLIESDQLFEGSYIVKSEFHEASQTRLLSMLWISQSLFFHLEALSLLLFLQTWSNQTLLPTKAKSLDSSEIVSSMGLHYVPLTPNASSPQQFWAM